MDFVVLILVVVFVVWLVRRRRRVDAAGMPRQARTGHQTASLRCGSVAVAHALEGLPTALVSRGRLSVVGESHYQSQIQAVVGADHVPGGGNWSEALGRVAALVPEPSNHHDRHAVRVDLQGADGWHTAGYLSRDDAREYQPTLLELVAKGLLPVAQARIVRVAAGPLAVYLHVAGPAELSFANSRPSSLRVLPADRSAALSGEGQHQSHLSRLVDGRQGPGNVQVWASLHPTTVTSGKNAGAPTLEVQVDGGRVGELTVAQAERFMDLLDSAAACEAEIYRGSKNLEVRVYLPNAPR